MEAKPLSMNTPSQAESTGSQSTSCCLLKGEKLPASRHAAQAIAKPCVEVLGPDLESSGNSWSKTSATSHTDPDSSRTSLLPSWFSPQHPQVIDRRTHEFPHASDHSTHCWAHIVGLIPGCTRTQAHRFSKQQTFFSFKL